MKNKLYLSELSKYINKKNFNKITYSFDNQPDTYRKYLDTCKVSIKTSNIIVKTNPNIIYLRTGEDSFIFFDRVQYALVSDCTPYGVKMELKCSEKQTHVLFLE